MTVTHKGKQYTVTELNDNEWRLASVENPRFSFTMDRKQMAMAGLLEQVEKQS